MAEQGANSGSEVHLQVGPVVETNFVRPVVEQEMVLLAVHSTV
jgi:hypothetical protein